MLNVTSSCLYILFLCLCFMLTNDVDIFICEVRVLHEGVQAALYLTIFLC